VTESGSRQVDAYIEALPEDRRTVTQQLRGIITAAAPQAVEAIAYKMPALRLEGRFFMSYDAYKGHCSLFPWTQLMVEELGDEIAPYLSGKGTLHFRSGEPLPVDLIRRIVAIRLRDFGAAR
jgi:uncharacterized protein YdhG (YjbR/CyaY superfamily)